MKKFLVVFVALVAAIAVAAPAMAKVEFSYGGQFRVRYLSQSNFTQQFAQGGAAAAALNAALNSDDDLSRFDERLRLYFTFTASENLKLVTKFEVGDATWGNNSSANDKLNLGRPGADAVAVEVKNVYFDFNIPNGLMPLNAKIGTQPFVLLDSWIVDDDFSGAYLNTKLEATKIGIAYISGQNNDVFDTSENIDDAMLHVDYVCGPFSANFSFFYQGGHDTAVSADPGTLVTPFTGPAAKYTPSFNGNFANTLPRNFFQRALQSPFDVGPFADAQFVKAGQNNLFDVGFQVKWKDDVWSAYLNFVKNFGSVDFKRFNTVGGLPETVKSDYTGWMVDAGGAYYCGPFTFNLGGFYTTGPEDIQNQFKLRSHRVNYDIDWFTYPLATSKYFSEIMGGGIFDNTAPIHEDFQWRGYGFPTNLWTVNVGAAWQVLPTTKLSFGYWYFGTATDVVSGFKGPNVAGLTQSQRISGYFNNQFLAGDLDFNDELGHEFNLNISQKVVDGLMLDLVAAYMIAGDAYSIQDDDDDAIELGARLQWSF